MSAFGPGDRVRLPSRPAWGIGTVIEEVDGRARVDFERAGIKTLALDRATLERVDDGPGPGLEPREAALARLSGSPAFARRRDAIESGLRPAMRLRPTRARESDLGLGFSRFGGRPDLPADVAWPRWRRTGRALSLVAQLRLSDVVALGVEGLPEDGWLLFFYEANEQPWGYLQVHAGGARVLFVEGDRAVVRREVPEDARRFRPARLELEPVWDVPLPSLPQLTDPWRIAEAERSRRRAVSSDHRELVERVWGATPWHHLLGHPQPIQSDMATQCELLRRGLDTGSGWPEELPPEAATAEWRLLLQLDSDRSPGWMWGDSGRLYFWIREEDLARRAFDRARAILQCY